MLLQEQMKQNVFSYNERTIINFILEKQEKIKDYSTKMIGDETYTAPSTVIRIHHDTLQNAIQILRKASVVKVFAVANLNFIGEEFVFKLNRIHKRAYIEPTQDNQYQDAIMTTSDECAICLSYSGETPTLLKTAHFLKENKVPIIAITSLGKNSLSDLATVSLNISTREKSFSKIAGFSSLESMNIILNILYSCLFSLDYQTNLDYKIDVAKKVELNRKIDNEIIEEHLKKD